MSRSGGRLREEGISRKRNSEPRKQRQVGWRVCVGVLSEKDGSLPRSPRRCSLTDLARTGTEAVEVTRKACSHVFVNINLQTFIPLYLGLSHDLPWSFRR